MLVNLPAPLYATGQRLLIYVHLEVYPYGDRQVSKLPSGISFQRSVRIHLPSISPPTLDGIITNLYSWPHRSCASV